MAGHHWISRCKRAPFTRWHQKVSAFNKWLILYLTWEMGRPYMILLHLHVILKTKTKTTSSPSRPGPHYPLTNIITRICDIAQWFDSSGFPWSSSFFPTLSNSTSHIDTLSCHELFPTRSITSQIWIKRFIFVCVIPRLHCFPLATRFIQLDSSPSPLSSRIGLARSRYLMWILDNGLICLVSTDNMLLWTHYWYRVGLSLDSAPLISLTSSDLYLGLGIW